MSDIVVYPSYQEDLAISSLEAAVLERVLLSAMSIPYVRLISFQSSHAMASSHLAITMTT